MSNSEEPNDEAPFGEAPFAARQDEADSSNEDQFDAESTAARQAGIDDSIDCDSAPTEVEAGLSPGESSQLDEDRSGPADREPMVGINDDTQDLPGDASRAAPAEPAHLHETSEESDQSFPDAHATQDSSAVSEPMEWDDSALDGPMPSGMCRTISDSRVILDTLAGRNCVFGYGYAPVLEAIGLASQGDMGDSAALMDAEFDLDRALEDAAQHDDSSARLLQEHVELLLAEDPAVALDTILLRPSADAAVESAIALARRCQPGKAFRTIAMVGSDHGRTGTCRSASGQPELHDGYGPMMAGFGHVPMGDIDALRNAIDDQTACIMISPIDLGHAATACDGAFLAAVRDTCDEHNLLLAIDETQLVVGAAGRAFTFRAIAEIHADIAILSAGLFAGLPGGLVLASAKGSLTPDRDIGRFPIHAAVATQTLSEMLKQGLPRRAADANETLAVSIAKSVGGFQFIRDIHATGQTIGVETDLDSRDVVRAARRSGLHVARAGSNAICLQPPLVIEERERSVLGDRLRTMMECLEREASVLAI